ncbi:MAG: DUF882 domain-containing protein [Syntrophobacteraceae bacterium]|nr:DUF882 domain-containing protein [Syntrophobacteraceae bacterium]
MTLTRWWILPVFVLAFFIAHAWPGSANNRFFLMGDGNLHIVNMHTGKEARVQLLALDGSFLEEGFLKIDEVFDFPTEEKGEHIAPRLLFMLDYFSDLVAPGKTIYLVSGYRDPEYNSGLREAGGNVAKTSLHMDGMALDFYLDGVKGKELWDLIRGRNCCGVGHYGGASIHLDSARPRFWEALTSKVHTGESDYNRRIYISSDFDRYRPGDTVRLSFSSVSDFGFGIGAKVALVDDVDGNHAVGTARLQVGEEVDCLMIGDRRSSRFLYLTLPYTLREGRYRMRLDFCRRPFEQMPAMVLSNEIEVLGPAP